MTTPLLPEDFLTLVNPLWATTELRGRVESVRHETADAVTLRIRPGRTWPGHRAGQYVRLGVDIDGVRHWRTYSLTCPEGSGALSITLKAVPGGVVSNHLVHHAPVGTIVHLDGAAGDFVLPDPLPDRLLLLTGGSGITPLMGMLRTLAARGPLPDVVLVHSAPTAADTIFAAELAELARAHPRLRLTLRATATEGRLDPADLDWLCPDWRDRPAWVCGPVGLLDAAEAHWAAADRTHQLHVERFAPKVAAVAGEGGTVTFGGTITTTSGATTTEVDGVTSLLVAGEDAGLLMPHGCRMGICFGCVLPLRAGRVRDLRTGEVHGDAGDLVQTCISAPAGDVELGHPGNARPGNAHPGNAHPIA